MNKHLLIASVAIFFASCDCSQRVQGTIVDDTTGKPISGANVSKKGRLVIETTDSTGHFEVHSISGGLLGCPDMKIVAYAHGYIKTEASIPAGGSDVIRLKPVATH